jgi:hypothetical protein
LNDLLIQLGVCGWFPLGIFFLQIIISVSLSFLFLGNAMATHTPKFWCGDQDFYDNRQINKNVTTSSPENMTMPEICRPVRRGVSKGVEDERRLPALWAGHPRNGCKAVLGVARPQGIEGLGVVGPGETLGSLWIPLAIRACWKSAAWGVLWVTGRTQCLARSRWRRSGTWCAIRSRFLTCQRRCFTPVASSPVSFAAICQASATVRQTMLRDNITD